MKHFLLMSSFIALIATGCSHTGMMNLSPDEEVYMARVNQFPLEFSISKADAPDAWGRAQSFIRKYCSMNLQYATDYLISAYSATLSEVRFRYYVTKTPMSNEVQILVQCNTGFMYTGGDANLNAHILAYYIKTGDLPYPQLIHQ